MEPSPLFSRTLNREVRPGTPCPICGETGGAVEVVDGDAPLPLRCRNGHTITMVRTPVVPE